MKSKRRIKWTRWQSIETQANWRGCAIYKIRLVRRFRPICIKRFLNPDAEGVVSIGLTTSMERRRAQFIRGWYKGRGHSEGNLLHLLEQHSRSCSVFDGFEPQYRFARCARNEIRKFEAIQIKDYLRKFGEVPPLNCAIPQRYNRSGWE